MSNSSIKKLLTTCMVTTAVVAAATVSASACTTIYAGGNLTEEGTPFVARSEDYGSDMNKLFFISEAGAYEGEFRGCPAYGPFIYELSKPSYQFTYFKNDNVYDGKCPECKEGTPDSPADHASYTEFGTNEKGVSVSATETISGNAAICGASGIDPYHNKSWANAEKKPAGIEETDIPTIILAEAATAREGVELLLGIYDEYGCAGGSGLFICDQNEVWYIENCSGTQYVAIKLNDDMIFLEPNMAVIGLIDLKDTEHVIASKNLIQAAVDAGTFVGDAENEIIDFRASYARIGNVDARLVEGLNFLNDEYNYNTKILTDDNTKFTISNLNGEGETVPMYTNIEADRKLNIDDICNYYKLSTIGKPGNQEIEVFQLFADRPLEYGTVGWVAVANLSNNVFVPYYPMLLDEVYAGYQVGTKTVTLSGEKPESGFCSWSTRQSKYAVYPENWKDSYYFSFEALGGYMLYGEQIDGAAVSADDRAYVKAQLNHLQQQFYFDFATMDEVSRASNPRAFATQNGMIMAEQAHKLAVELVEYLTTPGESVTLIYKDGTTQVGTDKQYRVGNMITVADALEKSGYTFLGWDTDAGGGAVVYKPGDTFEMTGDITLYAVWQVKSSGGSSSGTSYAITVSAGGNGSVTASAKQAAKGSTVTLRVKADSGYELDTLKVIDKNGDAVKTAVKSEGTYAFQMPASAVTVKAVFAKIEQSWQNPFHDVSSTSWYYEAVRYAAEHGLLSGTSANAFAPGDGLTRGMLVQILWSMDAKPDVSAEIPFRDVAEHAWYTGAVRWATANHIVSGMGDERFAPDAGVTREQLALILFNYAGRPASPSQTLNFADADRAASWSADALRWAVGAEILSGRDGGFLDPQGAATRAEVAQMMMKFDLMRTKGA